MTNVEVNSIDSDEFSSVLQILFIVFDYIVPNLTMILNVHGNQYKSLLHSY